MNIAMWLVVGGIVGWLSFTLLRFNVARGLVVSIIIGVAGAFFGGDVLAPLIGATPDRGGLDPLSLFTAFATAAGCLIIANMIYRRFDV